MKELEDNRKLYSESITYDKTFTKKEVWFDLHQISEDKEEEEPVTRDEVFNHVAKRLDSEIFIERNCSTLKSEDQIIRLSKYKEYLRTHLT